MAELRGNILESASTLKVAGNRLAGEKQYQAALEKYNAAIAIEPNFTQAWINKGLMHKNLQEYDTAIAAFKQTLAIDPNYTKATFQLAEILQSQGDNLGAWQLFNSILAKDNPPIEAELSAFACEKHIGAKLIFANADLKLTPDGQVKILEFGRGIQSGFVGLKIATNNDVIDLLSNQLQALELPKLILTNAPTSDIRRDESEITKFLTETAPPQKDFLPTSIANYAAIYSGLKSVPKNILNLDDIIANLAFEDKVLVDDAFALAKAEAYRPKTLKFARKYNKTLAKTICQEMPASTQFVVKTPNLERGEGIFIVKREDLDIMLLLLLADDQNPEIMTQVGSRYFTHFKSKLSVDSISIQLEQDNKAAELWNRSDSKYFMVEEYISNKPIVYNNAAYDATMRVAFIITRDNGDIKAHPFACYWKLPPQPLNSPGELRAKTVSSFNETRHDAIAVDPIDQDLVYQALSKCLPKVFRYILTLDVEKDIDKLPTKTEEDELYKAYAWMRFANALAYQGKYTMAMYYMEKAKVLIPNHFNLYHQFGVLYYLQEKYQTAEENFTLAITKNPKNEMSYYRRGRMRLEHGEYKKAKEDFEKLLRLNPSYKTKIDILLETYQPNATAFRPIK